MSLKFKKALAQKINAKRKELWDWYCARSHEAPPPFYCSIDLRDSGYKIAPVDCNLYPAGFNNICPEDMRVAGPLMRREVEAIAKRLGRGTPKQILVLPEAHTSNVFYIENLHYLLQIIRNAGFEVRLGWWNAEGSSDTAPIKLVSETGKELEAFPIVVNGSVLSAGDFVPDLILLNNDFSGGYPEALDPVAQPIVPSHAIGWHTRKKSEHFVHYNQLASEFAKIIDEDPWLFQIDTESVDHVNFNEGDGIEEAAQSVERMMGRLQAAHTAHQIDRKPFVFVKNNAGTYGMGIMVVHSAEELRTMNRRTKNKMSVGKNRSTIESVCVQEGVPTATLVDRLAAEPVIYMVGTELLGGFLRTNKERGDEDNLNSQGMVFRKLCMSDLRKSDPEAEADEDHEEDPLLELIYGSIARISALAAGREMAAHPKRLES